MTQIKIHPDYSGEYYWDSYCKTLDIELKQCIDEGLDIEDFELLFKKAIEMPYSKEQADLADEIFEKIINAGIRSNYKYNEPSDLDGIKALRKPYTYKKIVVDDNLLYKKIKGAWYGRICGCLLGKPLEGIKKGELYTLLTSTNNYPLSRYVVSSDITEEMIESYDFWLKDKAWADVIEYAPVDDDTTYTVLS